MSICEPCTQKLYVTDLDHTFLRSDLSISAFTKEIWNAKSEKALLSIATARSYYSASTLLRGFRLNSPLILLDGALIVSSDKQIIHTSFLAKEHANALIDEAIRFADLHPFVIGLKDKGLNETFDFPMVQTEIQQHLLESYKDDPRLLQHKRVYAGAQTFKIVYMGSKDEMYALTRHLKTLFGDTFEFKLSPENYSGGYFLTILDPLGDKAHGLQIVSHHLGKALEDITVFGDSINDIGMFKLAGTSVAVNNALSETKKVADIVLSRTNDDDGVAHYLDRSI